LLKFFRFQVLGSKKFNKCKYIFIFGSLGFLKYKFKGPGEVDVKFNKFKISDPSVARYLTYKKILFNLCYSVSIGYNKFLELRGVGFKYKIKNNVLYLVLGYSHILKFILPFNISTTLITNKLLKFISCNLNLLNQVIYKLKRLKSVNIYKGKGIFEKNEIIVLKEGKKLSSF
jgi:large subunit ribosomal protein L6